MGINRLRSRKNDAAVSRRRDLSLSNSSSIPAYYTQDSTYQRVSFLPRTDTLAYRQQGWTYRVMYWVTDGGKQIWNSGNYYLLSGSWLNDHFAWEPLPATMKPQLDQDDYIVDYAMGNAYACFVTAKGYVYAGGSNATGNLGLNDTTDRPYFERVGSYGGVQFGPGGTEKAVRIYTNSGFGGPNNRRTFVLTESGNLYGTGHNANYELGITGNASQQNSFVRCAAAITNIVEVYPGAYSTGALRNDGNLYVWGYNSEGELGVGDTTTRQTAVLSSTNVKKLSHSWNQYSYRNAFIVRNDGTVWFTGHNGNTSGSLSGLGDNTNRSVWTQVTTNLSGRNVVDVVTGGYTETATIYGCTWFLCDDGTVWATGYNGYGQLGDGTTTSRSTPVQLIVPTGFPKTDMLIHTGGYSVDNIIGVNKDSGRMWAVGSWNYGTLGYGFGDIGYTWPNRTSTSHRGHYPAREVDAPPPIQDGYAKFHSFFAGAVQESNSQQPVLYVLCTDGTVWTKGYNWWGANGTGYVQRLEPANGYNYTTAEEYNCHWRQVRL